ncbi:double-strand break repair protein AddB [Sphingomonas sp. SM33]|uniref:Double-strand break repair protein AddB n=1 Tax=Sphingomonas telluris TaxID=2907998 RepID=A0ABS9VKN5_9SPHN|nr:double-strand break repair protein AddB [Sphingomonas telluris]MCH8615518.1 double-strand break repair protein AddB [Sphingomonas telluris]
MLEGLAARPSVFTIPIHRSFADSLAAGLIAKYGADPLALAGGRILVPNNRAVRTVTEAFVRASGSGLLLPRLIPIGDPDLEERVGGALDPADDVEPLPPAIEPLERLAALASLVRKPDESSAEALRLASELARTMDALTIEEVDPRSLAEAAADAPELASHWEKALERFRPVLDRWPAMLAERGRLDLTDRRNRLLRRTAERWSAAPPSGFTVAAGVTTAAPAVAALLACVARIPNGMVVVPGLSLDGAMPDEEWEALGPDDRGRTEETHPQFHLKVLLDRVGVARGEVQLWPASGRASSPAVRSRAISHAMTAADFSDKWNSLKPAERRLTGVRAIEVADPAAEAQAIALAIREALETRGKTAALVTPDRLLAERVSALLGRWSIEADDSAGRALSQLAPGTFLLALVSAAAEDLAPVPLLALLKHPLVGGEGEARRAWMDDVRELDIALRGPRPAGGLEGLDKHFSGHHRAERAWRRIRPQLAAVETLLRHDQPLSAFAGSLTHAAQQLAGGRVWSGFAGRSAAELIARVQAVATDLTVTADDALPILHRLLEEVRIRPPYGGHPRVFIWGLLEARLQQADLMILGGLNEGVWPALPSPDPWLAPKIRANLGLPGLEFRVGLSAHDFASALGAPQVLITRSRRDSRSPTVASRLWLRLQAMTSGLAHETRLERLALTLDKSRTTKPADRPAPRPEREQRPRKISVTSVDRLKADPFAFYAQAVLGLRRLDPVDADHSAAWKGTAVHEVLEQWLKNDDCNPDKLVERSRSLLTSETIHPMLRALWQPRLMEAIRWIEEQERENQAQGRVPLAAELRGEAEFDGVTLHGKADRIDRLAGGGIGIVDYKTGKAPRQKAVEAGFSLQLGLLGMIAEAGGFEGISGLPRAHEYWSLSKYGDQFGKCVRPDRKTGPEEFLDHARRNFMEACAKWLTGDEPFTAKLNPAYAPYGDYDHLMRLEEWYGRR